MTSEVEDDGWDIETAQAKLASKYDGRKSARKARQKKLSKATDGRSLRASGRTEHLNFKAKPEIRHLLATHVKKGGISLFIEEAIIEKLRNEGVDI